MAFRLEQDLDMNDERGGGVDPCREWRCERSGAGIHARADGQAHAGVAPGRGGNAFDSSARAHCGCCLMCRPAALFSLAPGGDHVSKLSFSLIEPVVHLLTHHPSVRPAHHWKRWLMGGVWYGQRSCREAICNTVSQIEAISYLLSGAVSLLRAWCVGAGRPSYLLSAAMLFGFIFIVHAIPLIMF
eukprot:scaffold7627_cov151-Isochrysis_galbana.AAC.2